MGTKAEPVARGPELYLGFATHSAMIWGKTWLPQSPYTSRELLVGDKRKDVFESMA